MSVEQIDIRQFRNLSKVQLNLHSGLNLFIGDNASGKTSFLEAIYLLGLSRSFRSRRLAYMAEKGADGFSIQARLSKADSLTRQSISFIYHQRKRRIKVNGEAIDKIADLANLLPIQMINQQGFDLVDQGPGHRRKFLDWGVFHVEHVFYPHWQHYMRALKQRNAGLRQKQTDLQYWEHEMSLAATEIHQFRERYVEQLKPILQKSIKYMLGSVDIALEYRPGWDITEPLKSVLAQQRSKELKIGHTRHGPQRADLFFNIDGIAAHERLSRGQQKLFVSALILAQTQLMMQSSNQPCTLLIDDIAAELDEYHRSRLMHALIKTGAQLFVTATSKAQVPDLTKIEHSMFHVEHGTIS